MKHPDLSILIPAAGASARLGRAKQLVEYRGKHLLQRAVEAAAALSPAEIIVVTGAHAGALENLLGKLPVRTVPNPDWPAGLGGSIAVGAASVDTRSGGLMILLCDQWRIRGEDLQRLAAAWRADRRRIVAAEAAGRCLPPVIFPSACFERLRALQGEAGARELFRAHPERLLPVPMENAAFDLDTPEQLQQLQEPAG